MEGSPQAESRRRNRKAVKDGQYLIRGFMEFSFVENFPHYKGDRRSVDRLSFGKVCYFLSQSSSSRLFFCLPRYNARATYPKIKPSAWQMKAAKFRNMVDSITLITIKNGTATPNTIMATAIQMRRTG